MATNEGTLVGLEEEKQFQFNYRKRINGLKLIRRGNERRAIVRRRVRQKIKPFDKNLYEKLMKGNLSERDIQCDFWYYPEGRGNILPYLSGITVSYFASLKGVYFCKHLRDHHRDYRWLAVTFFPKKNTPCIGKMIKEVNCSLKKVSSSHLVKFRTFKTCFDVSAFLIVYPKAMQVMFTTLSSSETQASFTRTRLPIETVS